MLVIMVIIAMPVPCPPMSDRMRASSRMNLRSHGGFVDPWAINGTASSDTISVVVHGGAERGAKARRSELVNNSAARDKKRGVPTATARAQSLSSLPTRDRVRLLASPLALVAKSERTTPREGSCIRTTPHWSRVGRTPATKTKGGVEMKQWQERRHFGALDWASDHHDLVVVDRTGELVESVTFAHSGPGWQELRARLKPYPGLAVAVETNQGAAVQQLIEAGLAVYPVNPKSAQRYRERKAPSGVKDDQLDAWSLADALRLDGHGWRVLVPEDPLIE